MKKYLIACLAIGILLGLSGTARSTTPPTIVVVDTGVDMTNKIVSNRVVEEVCILVQSTCPNGKNFMDGKGSATLDPVRAQKNAFYHGTAMAGVIVENSNANVIMIRVIGMNKDGTMAASNVSVLEQAIDWVVKNKEKHNISQVSISLAIRNTSTCMTNKSIESNVAILKSLGVPVIAGSGNDSDHSRSSFPACVKDVITIGATDPAGSKGQFPALYSNLSDDFYALGTMNTYISPTTKSRSVGTSNATALFSSNWYKLDKSLSFQQKYDRIKSLAKVVSTAKVKNVLVVSQ
jgi:hypothetical protein